MPPKPPVASELQSSIPKIRVLSSTPTTVRPRQATSTVPIVFAIVAHPVGAGYVEPGQTVMSRALPPRNMQ